MKKSHPRVLMVFLDGVGIGRADKQINPFFAAKLPVLSTALNGQLPHLSQRRIVSHHASVIPINTTLGVAGLPQSGTGQTALFTGVNAPKLVGKHFGPYPYSSLRPIIAKHNIFRKLSQLGRKVFYANAYPQRYFDHIAKYKSRITVTVMAWLESGFSLNDHSKLLRAEAIAADITNERWVKLGFGDVPVIAPRKAGWQLISMLNTFDFVLYDYFYTDHAGHAQSMDEAVVVLQMLDDFLGGIFDGFDPKCMLLLITSDHGNIEDLSTRSHTRNPVPLIVAGAKKEFVLSRSKNLTHITPTLVELLR